MNRHERIEPNIYKRHRKSCTWMATGKCNCKPAIEARIYHDGRFETYTARTLAEARIWLGDKRRAIADGEGLPANYTVKAVCLSFISELETGTALNKYGKPFKPSVRRKYQANLEKKIIPRIGQKRIAKLSRGDLQRLVTSSTPSG